MREKGEAVVGEGLADQPAAEQDLGEHADKS